MGGLPTPEEMVGLQATRELVFMDTCERLRRVLGTDSYGEMVDEEFVPAGTFSCGFSQIGGERASMQGLPIGTEASMVVSVELELEEVDRVRITHLRGREVPDQIIYAILGPIQMGVSGNVVPLRRVTA